MLTKEETAELIRTIDNSISVLTSIIEVEQFQICLPKLSARLSIINKLIHKCYEFTDEELKEFSSVVKAETTKGNLLSGYYKLVK